MSYENILYAVDNGVARVTVNRPDKMNALNHQTITELGEAFDAAKSDDAVLALVLTGSGEKAFVAGADIVIHTAAIVAESGDWGDFDRVNAQSPRWAALAARDAGAEHRRETRDGSGVALAGDGEHLERLRVIGVGERGHGAGNEAARDGGKAGTWRCALAAQQPTVHHGATEAQRTERFRASEIREPGEERLTP